MGEAPTPVRVGPPPPALGTSSDVVGTVAEALAASALDDDKDDNVVDAKGPRDCLSTLIPPPVRLSDLEPLGIIGSGASGVARLCLHRPTGTPLVLKSVPFPIHDPAVRKAAGAELRALHRARHPGVVRCLESFLADGCLLIAMELVDGGSVARAVRLRHPDGMPERYLVELARQAAAALAYLHDELGVVHRDIKPANLLLSTDGTLKVSGASGGTLPSSSSSIVPGPSPDPPFSSPSPPQVADFGVSGQLGADDAADAGQCVSWVGTVTYMSPERVRGAPHGAASDVWSLGLSLLECALGRFPYLSSGPGERTSPPEAPEDDDGGGGGAADDGGGEGGLGGFWDLLDRIVEGPPPTLPDDDEGAKRQWSAEFRSFLDLCLRKDPAMRPSASALASHPWLVQAETSCAIAGAGGGRASLADVATPAEAVALVRSRAMGKREGEGRTR